MKESTNKKNVVVFISEKYGKVEFLKDKLEKLGKENILKAIRYIDEVECSGTNKIRKPSIWIETAIIGNWDLSIPEKENIQEYCCPDVEQTKKYLNKLRQEEQKARANYNSDKVIEIVDNFLKNIGSSREEIERRESKKY